MKSTTIIGIIAIVTILSTFMFTQYKINEVQSYTQEIVEGKDKCVMYDAYKDIYKEKNVANGLYWINKSFYCVWVEDRELDKIEKTDRHEYCHWLVNEDYEHFCKGVTEQ